jgi:hypothetical protein
VISAYKAKRKIKMDVHCLVDVSEVIEKNGVSSEETEDNSEETEDNSELSTQRKINNKKTNYLTTTTEKPTSDIPPSLIQVARYFKNDLNIKDYVGEAERFIIYNEEREWSCLPKWREAAQRWASRIGEE